MVWAYGLIGSTPIRNLPLKIASNKYGELSEKSYEIFSVGVFWPLVLLYTWAAYIVWKYGSN